MIRSGGEGVWQVTSVAYAFVKDSDVTEWLGAQVLFPQNKTRRDSALHLKWSPGSSAWLFVSCGQVRKGRLPFLEFPRPQRKPSSWDDISLCHCYRMHGCWSHPGSKIRDCEDRKEGDSEMSPDRELWLYALVSTRPGTWFEADLLFNQYWQHWERRSLRWVHCL